MKKGCWVAIIVLGATVAIAAGIFSWIKENYNGLVERSEEVAAQWANVENQYQRRADLIPNIVATVKGYAAHERATLEGVIDARARATQMRIDFNDLNEETLAKYAQVQGELSSALSRLMVVSEAYPELKANLNFTALQTELEGTENRISTERRRYNDAVQSYNVYVQQFPRNLLAGMFGFTTKTFFAAEAGAERAPKVEF